MSSQGSSCHASSSPYEVLTTTEVVQLMESQISEVSAIANLPKNRLRVLLTKCKWDTLVFLENFFDGRIELSEAISKSLSTQSIREDPPKENHRVTRSRVRKTGLPLVEPVRKMIRSAHGKAKKTCEICLENFSLSSISEIKCGHAFCYDCFKRYLQTTIENSSSIDCIRCPGHLCNSLLSDDLVIEKIDVNMKTKYEQLITNGFIENNRLIKRCIFPGCTRAIRVTETKQPAVRCQCGCYFCFQCLQEVHDLIPCKLLQDFSDVKAANIETASWLVENTKPCPKCHVNIEKNGGCNHITCRSCRFEFCWICFTRFSQHYSCAAPSSSVLGKTSLRRLVDCNTKHQTMVQSLQLEEKMFKSQLQAHVLEKNEQWMKIDFVQNAVEVLLRCRRSLADSYIFSYFFNNEFDTQWMRFEINQTNLVKATEDLSLLLESRVNGSNYHEMKSKISFEGRYCEGLHRALFDHVEDGFNNDSWIKTV